MIRSYSEDYKKEVGAVLARACKGEETANFEFALKTKFGDMIRLLLNATTRRDTAGKITGVVGVGQDVITRHHSSVHREKERDTNR